MKMNKSMDDIRRQIAEMAGQEARPAKRAKGSSINFVEVDSTPEASKHRGAILAEEVRACKKMKKAMEIISGADKGAVLAARVGGKGLARILCDAGFQELLGELPEECLSDRGMDGVPLIVRAAQMGQEAALEELLDLGADPSAEDSTGASALFHALAQIERIHSGRSAENEQAWLLTEKEQASLLMAARLILAGADALAPCRGKTPVGFLLAKMRPFEKQWEERSSAWTINRVGLFKEKHRQGVALAEDLLRLAIERRPAGRAIELSLVDGNPSGKSLAAEGAKESVRAAPSLASAFEARNMLDACAETDALCAKKAAPRL